MVDWLFQNTPLYLMTQSFWTDEGFSYLISKLPIPLLIQRAAADFNPPLYYLILHFWMKFFGTSEVTIRSLSLTFFAMTAVVFLLFLENVFKIKGRRNWFYLALFVGNPFLLYYAFEARMYALFALTTMLSYYFFIRKDYKWYSISILLGLYTHYFFAFVILTHLIYVIWLERAQLKKIARAIFWSIVLFLPWAFYSIPQLLPHMKSTWILPMTFFKFLDSFGTLYTGYEPDYWSYYIGFSILVSLIVLLIGAKVFVRIKKAKKPDRLLALLFLWTFLFYIIVALASFIRPIFVPRYLIFAPLGFITLLVYLLEKLDHKKALLLGVALLLIMIHYNYYQTLGKRKGDVRGTIWKIKQMARPVDVIYVPDAALYFTAS